MQNLLERLSRAAAVSQTKRAILRKIEHGKDVLVSCGDDRLAILGRIEHVFGSQVLISRRSCSIVVAAEKGTARSPCRGLEVRVVESGVVVVGRDSPSQGVESITGARRRGAKVSLDHERDEAKNEARKCLT